MTTALSNLKRKEKKRDQMSNTNPTNFDRVEGGDPERCEAVDNIGQCRMRKLAGSKHCETHDRHTVERAEKKINHRNYRLGKWQARIAEFADSEGIKSLRDEIGITRMLLETIVVKCQDESELLIYAPRISDLVLKIEKLVTSCHRLETSTGLLLDKSAALHMASVIVTIISNHISDPVLIDKIANEIAMSIVGTQDA